MSEPLTIGAIDAGSNAIRMTIARAVSALEMHHLCNDRKPVRLGRHVFTRRVIEASTLRKAVNAFRCFRESFDKCRVRFYRAVATSAAREARNGSELVREVRRRVGLRLEIVDSAEEARLVRTAVHAALGGADHLSPQVVADLGGGSLEINLFRNGHFRRTAALPLGTVRLMDTFGVAGAIDRATADELRGHVMALLRAALPLDRSLAGALTAMCGGNAEALARIAGGESLRGLSTMDLFLLSSELPEMLARSVTERMQAYGVRRDRAEVIGVAALVLVCLGRALGVADFVVPGVGVRDGILYGLARAHLGSEADKQKTRKGDFGHAHLPCAARHRR